MTEHKCFVFTFADVEVREREFCIVKAGELLPVEPKAFRVLLFMLRSPHRLIAKDELLDAVWNDCAVSDNSLTRSIALLRRLLGDDRREPRYIATVPTVGYRFLCDVKVAEDGFAGPNAAGLPQSHNGNEDKSNEFGALQGTRTLEGIPHLPGDLPAAARAAGETPKRWKVIVPMAAAVLAFLVTGYFYFHRRPKLTDKDTILLADFTNTTGDAVFDDTLKTALEVSLRQSPFLNVLSDRDVTKTLQQMTRPTSTKLTPEVARELCLRAGSKAYLAGSIGSLGSEYVLGLKAVNCESGDTLAEEQVTAGSKEKVLGALGEAASKLRGELGESLATVQKFDVPLEQATTSSLDALNAYTMALATWDKQGDRASLPLFQRALDLDPNFAMAYGAIATIYHNLGEDGLARKNTTRAYELKERVTDSEKRTIEVRYHQYVTGDMEKAAEVLEVWAQNYPERPGIFYHLAPMYSQLGRYDKAVDGLRRAIRLDPTRAAGFFDLAQGLLALGHFDDAGGVLAEADRRKFRLVGGICG